MLCLRGSVLFYPAPYILGYTAILSRACEASEWLPEDRNLGTRFRGKLVSHSYEF